MKYQNKSEIRGFFRKKTRISNRKNGKKLGEKEWQNIQ